MDKTFRNFLNQNSSSLKLVEEGLRTLALLKPGKDGEIRAEGVSSLLSLLTLYKDYDQLELAVPVVNASKSTNLLFRVAVVIRIIQTAEVFMEMLAMRKFRKEKSLLVIFILEFLKALLRLIIYLKRSEQFYSRMYESLKVSQPKSTCICGRQTQQEESQESIEYYYGKRSGRIIYRLDSIKAQKNSTDLETFLERAIERRNAEQRWVLQYLCPACSNETTSNRTLENLRMSSQSSSDVLRQQRHLEWESMVGEFIYIFRPAIHVLLLRKYGYSSWKPWLTGLLLDIFSCRLLGRQTTVDNTILSEELMSRKLFLLYYFVRSPFFENFLEPSLKTTSKRVASLPLVGNSADMLISLFITWRKYWFYTSAS
eukprot:jgi/Galph1/5503/GphlegSOOS_G4115.1